MKITESPSVVKMFAECEGGDGPDLSKYPRLVLAPSQWGDGVRVGSNGTKVEKIALDATNHTIERAAAMNGISMQEASDALRYARDHNLITPI